MKNKISSLYIHIPFCQYICSYCDFPKLQYFRNFAIDYLKVLKKELEERVDNKELRTIYVGGGTPTSLDDDLFLELLEMIKPYSTKVEEYTFEANPDSLSENKIKMMKEFGVNRLSLGVESTNDKILKILNRKHCFEQVKSCVFNAKKAGIRSINVDLILGLPNVSKALLKEDLENLVSLDPDHISTYSLTVHPHTVFGINKVEEPSEDFAYELYEMVDTFLQEKGYIHYEVSNFAKPGKESKHNFVYWDNEEYFGVGLGAAGYIQDVRYKNTTNLTKYLAGEFIEEHEVVSPKDKKEYQVMLSLRTIKGLDIDYVNKSKMDVVNSYINKGYLTKENNHLIPTFNGMMILDRIILDLLD